MPNLDLVFEVETNASGIGIGAILMHEGRVIEYYSEKFSDTRRKWLVYEQEFYAVIRVLQHLEHYLIQKDFVLHNDLQSL